MRAYDEIRKAADYISKAAPCVPETALILGSGLGDYAGEMTDRVSIAYGDIPGFPVSTAPGHAGKLHIGYLKGAPAALMEGRYHYYEGHGMNDVVFPVRALGLAGAKRLILTNASGGINAAYAPGDFMLISDHINFTGVNPLIGPNIEELGVRFPDMSRCWDGEAAALLRRAAKEEDIALREGVYAYMTGPSFETPAEIRALRTMGADAVGMSTVPEAVAARHMGMDVAGVSCITNMAAGMLDQPLTHQEVMDTGRMVRRRFSALLDRFFRLAADI